MGVVYLSELYKTSIQNPKLYFSGLFIPLLLPQIALDPVQIDLELDWGRREGVGFSFVYL